MMAKCPEYTNIKRQVMHLNSQAIDILECRMLYDRSVSQAH